MTINPDEYLEVAYRAWTNKRKDTVYGKHGLATYDRLILLDTETTTDVTQRFRFGFYREARLLPKGDYKTKREGIVYADDFEAREPKYYQVLMSYAKRYRIPVTSQAEFAKEFLRGACYNGHKYTALVGFNLPFDLSRIAYDVGESTALKGGFTFRMFPKRQSCPDDCHEVHKNHRSEPCKMAVMDFKEDGSPVWVCEQWLELMQSGNTYALAQHDCVDAPCEDGCNKGHHSTKCYKECSEKHKHEWECRYKCKKIHHHIPPYCPDNCKEDHKHHKIPCPKPWKTACKEEHEHRRTEYFSDFDPTLRIKHLDSKKSFIRWGVPAQIGPKKRKIEGQFIDLRQLIFGMTNRAVSLAGACRLFGAPEEYCKTHVEDYSEITPEFISYARQDVKATEWLAVKVLSEYNHRHYKATGLPATSVYSPATIGKSYLNTMGITPMLERGVQWAPDNDSILGHCTSTFFGARAEAHIRRYPLPVTVCDFTNMYGSVNMLMELWQYQTHAIRLDDSEDELIRFSEVVTQVAKKGVGILLDQETWKGLVGFAQIIPDGDILPVRARYKKESFNVGHNIFYSAEPVWYTYADVLTSAMLTGKMPVIKQVMRFKYLPGDSNLIPNLKPVVLGGVTLVDPKTQDLFRTLIEERAAIKKRMKQEYSITLDRDQEQNKVLVNAPSYGINVEMQVKDDLEPEEIVVYGQGEKPWKCTPNSVEVSGQYCYPPIGSVITGAARLMLTLTEKLVIDAGGNWVMGDTDSIAPVITKDGGLIPCPGGNHRMPDGREAVKALSRDEIIAIRETINLLNPYDKDLVSELLKDETENANKTEQVYAFAISAKRYCLFFYDENGRPIIPPDHFDADGNFTGYADIDGKAAYMQHGLGLYLNPADLDWTTKPDSTVNGHWMRETWQWILDRAHGIKRDYPEWVDKPALVRNAVTSPHIMRVFKDWNEGKDYPDQIKPFNFLLMATEQSHKFRMPVSTKLDEIEAEVTLRAVEKPKGPKRVIAPYSRDPKDWFSCDWYDLHDLEAEPVKISTTYEEGKILVKDFKRVLGQYEFHAEDKSAMPDGRPCNLAYSGVLQRRIVRVWTSVHIGKEANKLEEVEAGQFNTEDEVITTYPKDDTNLVVRAYDGISLREVARLVNAESSELAKQWQTESLRNVYGHPLPKEVDHKVIARHFKGINVSKDERKDTGSRLIGEAIIRTAAKRVASRIEIDERWIGIAEDKRYLEPKKVLAIWREEGCPGMPEIVIEMDDFEVEVSEVEE